MSVPAVQAPPIPARAAALDLRVLRALPFATVCVMLAAGGHAVAAQHPVPIGALAFGWLMALAAAIHGGRRRRGFGAIASGLALGQVGLHLVFQLAQAVQDAAPTGAMPAMPAMSAMPVMPGMPGAVAMPGMPGAVAMPGMPGAVAMPGMPGAVAMPGMSAVDTAHPVGWCHLLLGATPTMICGHLVATALAGWWLSRGEAAVWRLTRISVRAAAAAVRRCSAPLRALLAALLGWLGASPVRALPVCGGTDRPRPAGVLLRHLVVRRGPPALPAPAL
ncbi:hypothetical protein ACFW1A_35370 [Kitasatospora sp. NPDC058965]|uniref:hypothetical protein n=1 Tax=Kitasatospora sp. NPDC058965 TaxID=3346682 RepID=UPI003695A62F